MAANLFNFGFVFSQIELSKTIRVTSRFFLLYTWVFPVTQQISFWLNSQSIDLFGFDSMWKNSIWWRNWKNSQNWDIFSKKLSVLETDVARKNILYEQYVILHMYPFRQIVLNSLPRLILGNARKFYNYFSIPFMVKLKLTYTMRQSLDGYFIIMRVQLFAIYDTFKKKLFS